MRVLIEKLASLYPDIGKSRIILTYAEIKFTMIEFSNSAEENWVNIYNELKKTPTLLVQLYNEVIVSYPNEKDFFLEWIEEVKKNGPVANGNVNLSALLDNSELFDVFSIMGDDHAFINRQNVKTQLRDLLDPQSGKNTMLIQGKQGSGLTHVHRYIADVLSGLSKFFEFVLINPDFKSVSSSNYYKTGISVAKAISDRFGLGYVPEKGEKETESKYATFLNKLRAYSERENKCPVICLDGFYKTPNPDINEFIVQLLLEATISKTFYVIISLRHDNILKNDWPRHLRDMSVVIIDSFRQDDVKSFVHRVYSKFNEKIDLGSDPEELSSTWMTRNAAKLPFENPDINVKTIGKECTDWYRNFTKKINSELG